MNKLFFFLLFFLSLSPSLMARQNYVDGYFRKDGTYVSGHFKSSPDQYNFNNNSYKHSQPLFNDSYYDNSQTNVLKRSPSLLNQSNSYDQPIINQRQSNGLYDTKIMDWDK